jgi:hypothetical protein
MNEWTIFLNIFRFLHFFEFYIKNYFCLTLKRRNSISVDKTQGYFLDRGDRKKTKKLKSLRSFPSNIELCQFFSCWRNLIQTKEKCHVFWLNVSWICLKKTKPIFNVLLPHIERSYLRSHNFLMCLSSNYFCWSILSCKLYSMVKIVYCLKIPFS